MSFPHTTADCHEHHDQVVDYHGPAPAGVVTLCGSTRFARTFREKTFELTRAGWIVQSIGCDMHGDAELYADFTPEQLIEEKRFLDELHRRKIDRSTHVLVLNLGGYIGESTAAEIEYAVAHGIPVYFLEGPEQLPAGLRQVEALPVPPKTPYGETPRELRVWMVRDARLAENVFSETISLAVTEDRKHTDNEVKLTKIAHSAMLYGFGLASIIGWLGETYGPLAALQAASIVDDMGHNGGADWCDDISAEAAAEAVPVG